jgi:hypothetical protein
MVGPVSSLTQTQSAAQPQAPAQNSGSSKPPSGGEDSVHLSSAAQAKLSESQGGCNHG